MEVQHLWEVSKRNIFIIGLLLFNLLVNSCQNNNVSLKDLSKYNNSSKNLTDSCINQISIGNPDNVMANYGDLSSQLTFEQNKFPYVKILNQSKKECLEALAWNGDGKNTFRYFKVYFNDKDLIKNSIHSKDISFISCLGIKLGATKGELLHILGKPSSISHYDGIDQIEYNQELYKAKYRFKDDRLIEFEFGEVYP